jgi:hypothetical protein
MGESRWDRLFAHFDFNNTAPGEPSLSRRHTAQESPGESRVRTQDEVVRGLSAEEALEECRRCLRCDLRNVAGGT